MKVTLEVTDESTWPKLLEQLGYDDSLLATHALRAIRHHRKEIEEHRKLLRTEVSFLRKLIKGQSEGIFEDKPPPWTGAKQGLTNAG